MMLWRRMTMACLCPLVAAGMAAAQDTKLPPGINERFKDPSVPEFVERFEREGREVYDKRNEIIEACHVRPGASIADVGAGTGLFTRLFAAKAGPEGRVFAVDISQKFVDHVLETCRAAELKNVVGIVCTQESTELPAESVDLVFVCDTYHHFEFPQKTLASIRAALRPGGDLVVIDFERIEGVSSEFILGHVRAGKEVFRKEIEQAGFTVVEESNLFKENYLLHVRKS